MNKDILYNSNILKGLFTRKDFEFLKDTNDRQEELEFQIKMADLKRDEIIECIKKIDIEKDEVKNIDPTHLKKYVDSAERAFKSINNIIRNLTKLSEAFEKIEKQILDLIVKKERNSNIDEINLVKNINEKINDFKSKQMEIENENSKNLELVDEFLKNTDNRNQLNHQEEIYEKIDMNRHIVKRTPKRKDDDLKDNLELIVSERQKRVYLPYTKLELEEFLNNYPDEYKTARDVINREFIADIALYNKHPILARFREAYSLIRNKEMKSTIDSLKYAMDLMFRSEINPTIIAAVKSQNQLESYIECLEQNRLDKFKYFKITFEVNPMSSINPMNMYN